MKMPNGYGSVTKLSGNRRKPWIVRISEKTTFDRDNNKAKIKRSILGYYATRKEALQALADYNESPYNLTGDKTFLEIYDIWKKKNYDSLSESTQSVREAALKYCEPLYNISVRNIKTAALQDIIDSCPYGFDTKRNIKTIMRTVFQYALQNDLTNKDYSEFVEIEHTDPVIERKPYTKAEINALWKRSNEWDIAIILILLYSGMRVNELLKNTKDNVNLEERWIYIPKELAKNKSSIRYVPIHDRIYDLVKEFYDRASTSLITNPGGYKVSYNNYVARNLKRINEEMHTNHKMHDTRHTFISRCHECKVDDLCTKKIVGHTPDSITQKVYTHITMEQMQTELSKLE